jgi:O-antigen ligase
MDNIYKIKKIDHFQILLLSLLPCALVVGPFIAEIIIISISIFFLFDIIKQKKLKIFKNKFFYIFFSFYFLLVISLITSEIFSESALNVFSYLRFFIFAFAAFELIKKNQFYIIYFFTCLSVTVSFVVFDGYLQFFTGENILGYPKYRPDRLSGFFNDDLIIGSYLLRILPIFIGLTIYLKNKIGYFFYINLIIVLLTCFLILLSGERASFFLLILFLFLIITQLNFKKRYVIFILAITISSISILLLYNQTLKDRYVFQMKKHLFGEKMLSYYSPMFSTSYKMFIDKPILGFGPKAYRYYC